MQLQYILVGKIPVQEPDLLNWVNWYMSHNRVLKKTYLPGGVKVSTVFLALDHGNTFSIPLLFETMIFGGKLDLYRWRYKTYCGALAGHKRAIKEALRFKNVTLGKIIARNNNRYKKAKFGLKYK